MDAVGTIDTQAAAAKTGIPWSTLRAYVAQGILKPEPAKAYRSKLAYQWTSQEAALARVAHAILGSTRLNYEAVATVADQLRTHPAGSPAFLAVRCSGSQLEDSRIIGAEELPALVLQGYLVFHASPMLDG